MSRLSSRLTRGRNSTARTRLNIAALAPIPRARVATTVAVRPFARARERAPTFSSPRKDRMFSIIRYLFVDSYDRVFSASPSPLLISANKGVSSPRIQLVFVLGTPAFGTGQTRNAFGLAPDYRISPAPSIAVQSGDASRTSIRSWPRSGRHLPGGRRTADPQLDSGRSH